MTQSIVAVNEEADNSPAHHDENTSKINISGDTVIQATARLEEHERKLIRWAYDFARSNNWDWKEAARNYKSSTTVLYRVWSDKYRQPEFLFEGEGKNKVKIPNPAAGEPIGLEGLCEKIERFKRLAEQRHTLDRLPFVETSVWRRIAHVADETLISQSIGMVFGESQIGKTRCLEEYQRRNNHGQTILVTMPPAAGVQLMCKEIAAALHIGESSFDKTFTRIIKALDGDRLLIIDEAHMVFETLQKTSIKRCLATLRHIHDRSKCGLLICATDVFPTEAKNSEFRNTMKQFFRRTALELRLGTQPPWEDVVAICAHYKLALPIDAAANDKRPEIAVMQRLSREDGLGKITKFLAGAARMAAKKHQPLNWSHFARYHDITERMSKEVKGQ